jgi:Ala-tRNA(Pro) deacylase
MTEWTPAQAALFARLDALGIAHSTKRHPPVHTVSEARALRDDIPGAHTKNLFVKDKKGAYFLLVLEELAEIDLKRVHGAIGASGRVSFGKPEALIDLLGVTPGSVTALAALNDRDRKVAVVVDEALLEHPIINAHPLANDATTSLANEDFVRFLSDCGHDPLILKLSG